MKLASLKDGSRDGSLVLVSYDLARCVSVRDIAPHMQHALDVWDEVLPALRARAEALEKGLLDTQPFDPRKALSPLPRAYEWVDGSAYLNHVVLVRKARKAEVPETLYTDPLVYQGGSGTFLSPMQDIPLVNPTWGLDFEAEVAVVLKDTPQGTRAEEAHRYVALVMLVNDVTLRNLIPNELAKGFGFFCSKPSSAFSPCAVTPDVLGEAWKHGRVHLPLLTCYNGVQVGRTQAGPEMHFSFYQLIEHICKTRSYTAGTVLGSGTVSNADRAYGISCLAEQRMLETIEQGEPKTPFMSVGDRVQIHMLNAEGQSVFGLIDQKVVGV
jgi:fumarylacetoacetate (FAA) hydrolase